MADVITLIPRDDEGERIVDDFAKRTGLHSATTTGRRVFAVHGPEHAVQVVHVLDDIAADWTRHVSFEDP